MRLLYTTSDEEIKWTEDIVGNEKIPPYAILSHTWGQQEVVFDDLKSLGNVVDIDEKKRAVAKKQEGWNKILFCANQAKLDGLDHFWVDTCCIDKANHTELSEAINSMFRWYQSANKCYVFLSDVEGTSPEGNGQCSPGWETAFRASRWFTRGWTLQELIGPRSVEFFSKDRSRLGNKESLKQTIHEITKIPIEALSGSDLSQFSIAERFSWAQDRQTTREEDGAYCLLGIFGCHLPLIYGEGKEKALNRLRKEMLEASEDITGASMNYTKFRNRNQEENFSNVCSWLSVLDPSTNHRKAQKQRQAETGLWLLESAQLKKWKEGPASRLWLHGIPGCGKTILSSTVIDHLLQHCHDDLRKATIYFYFDFNDSQKQDPELMLRSLLCQLLQRLGMIPRDVDALFSSCGKGQRQPSLHALLEIAPQVMRQFTHVYIVFDALDECAQRIELMDVLETMAGWQLDIVHCLMTSRKERDIEMSLKTFIEEDDVVGLERDVVDKDILQYVQQRLRKDLAKWNKHADTRQEIETALMQGARGMFRWAVCQLDTLAKCRNLATLRTSLATLPQTLDQTYDRILTAIREEDRVYAMRILQWLTFSARPLTVEEVAEIAAVDVAREPAFNREEVLIDPLDVLDICSSLVTITTHKWEGKLIPTQQMITLAHYSVKEYLVSDRIKQGPAKQYSMQEVECHKVIAEGSLRYLNQFQQPIFEELLEASALARYSAEFWSSHLQKIGDEAEEVNRVAMNLLSTENPAYLTWIRLYDPEIPYREPDLGRDLESIATPLYYAALLGSSKITRLLLDQGADVKAQGGNYGNALQAASAKGHKAVVKLLIEAGADVNASGGQFGNALQAASAEGYEQIASILLNAHAMMHMQGGLFSNALHAALVGGHEPTVRILLERDAGVGLDLRAKGAMHHAVNSARCTPLLVSTLQEHGAPLDTIDFDNMTPLHYCVKFGHEAIAKQLLDLGVPIDIRVCRQAWPSSSNQPYLDQMDTRPLTSEPAAVGLTPLHFAALTGNVSMTRFLLKHGADPNALSEFGETPLHLTLRSSILGTQYQDDWNSLDPRVDISFTREGVLDLLLADSRTSLTVTDHRGESSLHCIRYNEAGSAIFVQMLVFRGADPLCGNLWHQTPLHFACKAGDHVSVRGLLSIGATAASTDECGLNALHYAAQSGNLETIIVIFESGEARTGRLIASKDNFGQNVLHHVLSERFTKRFETVRWLLNQGVNSSELDIYGISPLVRFITNSEEEIDTEILELLLDIGENASFVNEHGQNLGHLCAGKSFFGADILAILNGHMVDLAEKDCDGRTVLHCAAIAGFLDELSLNFLIDIIGIGSDEKDNFGNTALQYAMEAAVGNHDSPDQRWERVTDILLRYQASRMDCS